MKIVAFKKLKFPDSPGVYFFLKGKEVLYIGKATSLRDRVKSYFGKDLIETRGPIILDMVFKADKIKWKITDSVLEALILEAELIKKHQPIFNVQEKDDKSFLYVEITKETFPRVVLVRGKDNPSASAFGPFISGSSLREALKILRRIFPWNTHPENEIGKLKRECLQRQIGLCPGTCVGAIDRKAYLKNIAKLKLFFKGRKKKIVATLEREMAAASKKLEFEEAGKICPVTPGTTKLTL